MLEVGKIYQFRERIREGADTIIRRRAMRLVKKYPHHMLFETPGVLYVLGCWEETGGGRLIYT